MTTIDNDCDLSVSRQIQISRGCIPYLVESMTGTEQVVERSIRYARDELKIIKNGSWPLLMFMDCETHAYHNQLYR